MDKRLQQRLIGAAVVIALAVIFVPMLLSGGGGKKTVSVDMKIPPEPAYSFNGAAQPPAASTTVQTLRVIPTAPSASVPQTMTAPAPASSAAAPPAAPKVVEPHIIPPPTPVKPAHPVAPAAARPPAQSAVAAAPKPAAPPARPAPPSHTAPAPRPASGGWAVQVATVYKKAAAEALRARLEKLGYNAYVTRFDDIKRHKVFYQVRVGPVTARTKAAELIPRLQSAIGLKGYVVHYP